MGMFPRVGLVKGKDEPLINKMRLSLHMAPVFSKNSGYPDIYTAYPGSSQSNSITSMWIITSKVCVPLCCTHTGDFAVDLGGVLALGVRVLRGGHLQDAHSEGVDIHRFVVLFLVHLRGHELWRSWKRRELDHLIFEEEQRRSTGWSINDERSVAK